MADSTPVKESRLKHLATLVASTAALLTSMAALLEACDKSVEKKTYEVLSQKIVELQEAQAQPILMVSDGELISAEPILAPSAAPSASSAPRSAPTTMAKSLPIRFTSQPVTVQARPAPPPDWGTGAKPAF